MLVSLTNYFFQCIGCPNIHSENFHVGWLASWLVVLGLTAFQSISGRQRERGRKKREMIKERKNAQTTPPASTASTVGPCPTIGWLVVWGLTAV